jgi:glycosyltransferase involved in cell wall biosynthesis
MSEYPLISIIIPVHNGDRYLAEAINSVLAQNYSNLELIIIDDGSTDQSSAIAQGYGAVVHYEYQQQQGAGAARNRGVELATGEFLAFLDADDLWVVNKLTSQISAFEDEPTLEAIFGQVQQFHSPDLLPEDKAKIYCPTQMMPGYSPSVILIRRKAFLKVGLFETHLQVGEFVSWYARATEAGLRTKLLPELMALRRLHRTNTSRERPQAKTDFARLLKASLDRRRAQLLERSP